MRWRLAGIPTILALICTGSQAEELTEFDFLDDRPIVVSSATRLTQELQDVPASVTVIDRNMIEASSAINLIELLRLVPGFQIGSIDGTESTATYHGLSTQHNKRLQILVNGRSIYQSIYGGALWYSLPVSLEEIERIEVLRGPNAASFGANAFSAVVNITTFRSDHKPGLKIGHLGGERDMDRNYFIFSRTVGNSSFRINAETESNTGYAHAYRNSHTADDPVLPVNTDYPLYDDHFHRQMNLRIDHMSDSGSNHLFEFGFKDLKYGNGYIDSLNDETLFDSVAAFDKKVDTYFLNYLWEKTESLLLTNRLRISYNFIDQDEPWFGSVKEDKLESDGFGSHDAFPDSYYRDTSFQDRRFNIEFQQNRILSPSLQSVWGIGARYDESNSIGPLLEDSHSRYSINAFGHVEWKQNDLLTWNAGGFLENHEDIGTFFSPRVALNLKPSKEHAFRANISKAYRMPSLEAEYADMYTIVAYPVTFPDLPLTLPAGFPFDWWSQGNDQLDPESMTSFELGYRGLFFDKKLDIDIRLAREKIQDIIEATQTYSGADAWDKPRFRWFNYGEAEIDSVELQLNYRPDANNLLRLHASYANTDGFKGGRYTDIEPFAPCRGDTPLNAISCQNEQLDLDTPLLTTGFLFWHRFDNGLSVSSQYSYHDAYLTGGDGDYLNTPFETLDIKISKTWSINNNDIRASLIVRNIADEYYEDFENDNLVDREAYFQLEAALY